MKRHPALYTLSHDHHQGLILAQQLKKGAPQYKGMPSTPEGKKEYTISFYKTELIRHFENEEKILFPMSLGKNASIDKLIAEIINEHRKLEALVEEIRTTAELERVMDELGHLLEKHIRKEERELFVMIEEALNENDLDLLSAKLKQTEKTN
ncbi:MAG TPA: hemerythrin domain-containing protein [Ignavibacteriaceae bacterium]|nr:hemerythrin domain-containing protein [Ignavibacteriaceae bacterium]